MDLTGPSPAFSIVNIVTPYGSLRDRTPLPGDVVTKMATSIEEMASMYSPRILLSTTSITLTLDEGRGFGTGQSVTVTNSGIYGSLLSTSLTSSVGYVTSTPPALGGIGSGTTGTVNINADSSLLTAANSPYSTQVLVEDANATNNPQTINVTVVVRPKAAIEIIPEELLFNVGGPLGGPWPAIPPQTFQVLNDGLGPSVLNYQVEQLQCTAPWIISVSPTSGTLTGGSTAALTVNVSPQDGMQPGVYEQYIRVSGYSSNGYKDLYVALTIT